MDIWPTMLTIKVGKKVVKMMLNSRLWIVTWWSMLQKKVKRRMWKLGCFEKNNWGSPQQLHSPPPTSPPSQFSWWWTERTQLEDHVFIIVSDQYLQPSSKISTENHVENYLSKIHGSRVLKLGRQKLNGFSQTFHRQKHNVARLKQKFCEIYSLLYTFHRTCVSNG